jgi:hypothetical protein
VRVKGGCHHLGVRRASVALLATVLLAGCGSSDAPRADRTPTPAPTPRATPSPRPAGVERAHCPAGSVNCAAVTGRVVYVEGVDPDGDGDAHYILSGGHVTAPGVSVVDVAADLRPRRLPRLGDLVSAAGPVYTGSHGQKQIQAVEVHHQRD